MADTSEITYVWMNNAATGATVQFPSASVGYWQTKGWLVSDPPVNVAVTLPETLLNIIDAKGDLLVGTGDNVILRLPVGGSMRYLLADPAAQSGVRWSSSAAIDASIVDAKGDLIVATGDNTVVRKAAGAQGARLEADLNSADGLSWDPPVEVARNYALNPFQTTGGFAGGAGQNYSLNGNTAAGVSGNGIYTPNTAYTTVEFGGVPSAGRWVVRWVGFSTGSNWAFQNLTDNQTINYSKIDGADRGGTSMLGDNAKHTYEVVLDTTGAKTLGLKEIGGGTGPSVGIENLRIFKVGADSAYGFNGDTPGCFWTGVAYNSASVRSQYGPEDVLRVDRTPELARNAVLDPSNLENNNGVTYAGIGAATFVVDAPSADASIAPPTKRYRRARVTATTSGVLGVGEYTETVSVGLHRISYWVRTNKTSYTPYFVQGSATFTQVPGTSDAVTVVANGWTRFYVEVNVLTAGTLCIGGYVGASGVGDYFDLSSVMVPAGNAPVEYFDGDTPGCRWTGTRARSASAKMTPTKTDDDLLVWLDAGRAQGVGSPEGKVAATPGTRYVDKMGATPANGGTGTGAIEWIKVSGTGNTGWRVSYGDTGIRDITSALINGWTAQRCSVQRSNNVIIFHAENISGANATSDTILSPGVGWSCRDNNISTLLRQNFYGVMTDANAVASTSIGFQLDLSGSFTFRKVGARTAGLYTSSAVPCTDSWPTTLPGVPAT